MCLRACMVACVRVCLCADVLVCLRAGIVQNCILRTRNAFVCAVTHTVATSIFFNAVASLKRYKYGSCLRTYLLVCSHKRLHLMTLGASKA